MAGVNHKNLLLLKANPELDFKYFSKAYAFSLVLNAQYHATTNGTLDLFEVVSPALCSARRFFKSAVAPIYRDLSFLLSSI